MTLIKIADGNSKLGAIPNISTIPGKDCGNCSACVKGCYAVKFYKMYPNVRAAWDMNSNAAHTDREGFFAGVREYLVSKNPKWFRWHVSGDILDQAYLDEMKAIAKDFPAVGFLAFTKMHHLDFGKTPKNLTIIASMWPGLELPKNVKKLPKAWMQDGTEARVPEDAIPCPGRCDQCMMCWHLPNLKRDVVFEKH